MYNVKDLFCDYYCSIVIVCDRFVVAHRIRYGDKYFDLVTGQQAHIYRHISELDIIIIIWKLTYTQFRDDVI